MSSSPVGCDFVTSLMPLDTTTTVVAEVFKMADRPDDCSGRTFLALCAKSSKGQQRKMTKYYYYWIVLKKQEPRGHQRLC